MTWIKELHKHISPFIYSIKLTSNNIKPRFSYARKFPENALIETVIPLKYGWL